MTDFTPVSAIAGGALIAIGLAITLVATGRIAGLSGIFAGCLTATGDRAWRQLFVVGMLVASAAFQLAAPSTFDTTARVPLPVLAIAGVLVGFGTRLGNGCTSGHGLCGLSRFSLRSLVATLVFIASGAATVFAWRHLLGHA